MTALCRSAKAEALVRATDAKEAMVYWSERAMRAESALTKLVDALEQKGELHFAFVEARALIARGFANDAAGEQK